MSFYPSGQCVDVLDPDPRMGLLLGPEIFLNSEVDLQTVGADPESATGSWNGRLLNFCTQIP